MAHRTRRTPQTNKIPSTALVASAARFSGGKVPRVYRGAEGWQKECYRHYGICGEARFAANYFGSALSRANLVVKREINGVQTTVKDGNIATILATIFPGVKGQSQALKAIGRHMTIAGECYLIGRTIDATDEDGNTLNVPGTEVWEIVAVTEVRANGAHWSIARDGEKQIDLDDDDTVIRIWNPSPENAMQADSPFRSLLPVLQVIEWLSKYEWAQLTSRLAGAGILFLPQGMTFPTVEGGGNEAEQFVQMLGQVMLGTIQDPSKPEALVPTVVTAPAEAIAAVEHMTFWSELDAKTVEIRTEAIRRFAVGIDMPPEQLLGMGDGTGGGNSNGVSHWGAWQVEEATIKMHVEPALDNLIHAIITGLINPLFPDETDVLTHDTSALRLRPDRSKEAMELYQMGALSMARMLEENGFAATDIPDEEERKQFYLRTIASGSATPEQVEAALLALGVTLDSAKFKPLEEQGQTRETPQPPSLEEHPTRPRTPAESAALIASCEGVVLRALERAGNRVINSARGRDRDKTREPLNVHVEERINGHGPALLAGAFTTANIALADREDRETIIASLNDYCLGLFESQAPYDRASLARHLEREGVIA